MIAIAPTDLDWFELLRGELPTAEINFWTPTPWNISRLEQGDRFYFLLKAPYRKIGGYGHFRYYENMSAREAWNRFGKDNGVDDLAELVARTAKYAYRHSATFVPTDDPEIGCIILDRAVFFKVSGFFTPEEHGKSFPREVVRFKYFDEDCDEHSIRGVEPPVGDPEPFRLVDYKRSNYKTRWVRDRVGQAAFRQKVLAAYGYRCCVTGEGSLEVLDAAHIQTYVNRESSHVPNGLALRTDFHKLFDAGLITIDDDYHLVVSDRLDSRSYAAYHGQEVLIPDESFHQPSKEALEAHRTVVFRT